MLLADITQKASFPDPKPEEDKSPDWEVGMGLRNETSRTGSETGNETDQGSQKNLCGLGIGLGPLTHIWQLVKRELLGGGLPSPAPGTVVPLRLLQRLQVCEADEAVYRRGKPPIQSPSSYYYVPSWVRYCAPPRPP